MNAGEEDTMKRQNSSHFLKVVLGILFEEMCKDRRGEGEIDHPIKGGKDHFRSSQFSRWIVGF